MLIFATHQKRKNPRKILIYRDFLCFTILSSGETGKQKQFSTFPNKLFYNMLLQEKNTNFLFFVADMSLDTTLIPIENQQI